MWKGNEALTEVVEVVSCVFLHKQMVFTTARLGFYLYMHYPLFSFTFSAASFLIVALSYLKSFFDANL